MRAGVGGTPGPVHDDVGVAGEVADGRVHLGESESELRHAASLSTPGSARRSRHGALPRYSRVTVTFTLFPLSLGTSLAVPLAPA